MTFDSTQLVNELRAELEQLITLVTSPEAQTATVDQMERAYFHTAGQPSRTPLDGELSLPDRRYSDLWMVRMTTVYSKQEGAKAKKCCKRQPVRWTIARTCCDL